MSLIISNSGTRLPDSLVNNSWVTTIQPPKQDSSFVGEKAQFNPPSLEGLDLSQAVDLNGTLVPGGGLPSGKRFDTFTRSGEAQAASPEADSTRSSGLILGKAVGFGRISSVQTRTDRTAEKAITDAFTAQIQELAKKDAKKGIYMDEEFSQLRRARMQQYVSPDRAGPMAQVNSILQDLSKEQDRIRVLLDRLLGNCSAEVQGDSLAQTAEIRSPDGEVIASYNSLGGGWTEIQTKEEHRYISETDMIYLQAFREARAEMNARPQAPADSINVQA